MKKALWILSSLALAGFAFVGCDEDSNDACNGECDADTQVCAPIKGGTHECLKKADIPKCIDASGNFVSGKVIEKSGSDLLCVANEETHTNTCESDSQCSGTTPVCNTVTKTCEPASSATEFKFVKIEDLTTDQANKGKSDPGADIDAVVLTKKADGAQKYVKDVVKYQRGSLFSADKGKIIASDFEKIKGAPDSLTAYGTDNATCKYFRDGSNSIGTAAAPKNDCDPSKVSSPSDSCDYDYTFVSLGGDGGYIIVEMDGAIEAEDTLDIVEVGDCTLSNTASGSTSKAKVEKMKVQVSVTSGDAAVWKVVESGKESAKGVLSINITADMLK